LQWRSRFSAVFFSNVLKHERSGETSAGRGRLSDRTRSPRII